MPCPQQPLRDRHVGGHVDLHDDLRHHVSHEHLLRQDTTPGTRHKHYRSVQTFRLTKEIQYCNTSAELKLLHECHSVICDLQTTPSHIIGQLDKCLREASTLDGVLEFRNEHFWTLGFGTMVSEESNEWHCGE